MEVGASLTILTGSGRAVESASRTVIALLTAASPVVVARRLEYLYFSYVSLTTVAYGDLTAATDVGRVLAVSEALIGRLYLVTVVALLVGNIVRGRSR
jgi:hypothetical protein